MGLKQKRDKPGDHFRFFFIALFDRPLTAGVTTESYIVTDFTGLGLNETLMRAIADEGYTHPTEIQAQAIPAIFQNRDVLGLAQTGAGKTAAFALPLLHILMQEKRRPTSGTARALILAPTRELAAQIADNFKIYGRHARLSVGVIFGGVSFGPQIDLLRRGVDVLVATPGRLIDHMQQGRLRLDETRLVVLDEADHMMDLGFIVPLRRILRALPADRRTLMFSATMPDEISKLANEFLKNPLRIEASRAAVAQPKIDQKVYFVSNANKRELLLELANDPLVTRALVFTRTKRGADRVCQILEDGGVSSGAIHGNKSQNHRQRTLNAFRRGHTRILVATDIAARGIDVDDVSHVFNFELPEVPESYVHRIGRTARAGRSGIAVSLCDDAERSHLRAIEKLTRQNIAAIDRRVAGSPTQDPMPARKSRQPKKAGGRPAFGAGPFSHSARNDGPRPQGKGPRDLRANNENVSRPFRKPQTRRAKNPAAAHAY